MRTRALLLAAALLLPACTSDDGPGFRQPSEQARTGGVLTVGVTAPGSVDPGNVYEPVGELVVRTLCTPLLATDPQTAELVPAVATSWTVSEDGTSVVLRLRDDLVFSDGTDVTAEDVAYTFTRIASADFASTSADRLAVVDGFGEVHGDVPTDDDLDRRRLRGVEVRDDRTVAVQLAVPHADVVRLLSSPLLSPVSKRAAERDPQGFGRAPVCVGPYALAAPYAPGDPAVRLVRSRAHVPTDASLTGGGTAYADEVVFRVYPDAARAAAAVASGEVDLAPARPQDTAGVVTAPGPELELVGLPTSVEVFADPRVRRALSLALDREALVRRVFGGRREAATGFLPRTSGVAQDCDAVPPQGDVEAARALLREAGVDLRGVRVPLHFNDEFSHRAVAVEVARQWAAATGLVAVPAPSDYPGFLARATGQTGFDGAFRWSWSVPWSDVDGYLAPLYTTAAIGRDNPARFSDPAVDQALLREAREASDPQDRALAYARVLDLLCEAVPMVPLTTSTSRWVVAPDVASASGRVLDASTGRPLLRELYRTR